MYRNSDVIECFFFKNFIHRKRDEEKSGAVVQAQPRKTNKSVG